VSAAAPAVSVVLSVYNGARFLREAVDSVLGQEFRDFELILVDDGSDDATPAVMAAFTDRRVRCLRNGTNLGLARSLNVGIEAARGRYIARHDADDVSEPARLGAQVRMLDEHPEIGALGAGVVVIDIRGRRLSTVLPPPTDAELRERLQTGNCFFHGSVMLRRSSLMAVGGYRLLPVCQDYDLWLRISERDRLAALPAVLYRWRLNPSSLSIRQTTLQLAYIALVQDLARARREHGVDRFDPDLRPTVAPTPWGFPIKEAALARLVLAGRFAAYGDTLRALRLAARGLAADPTNVALWRLVLSRGARAFTRAVSARGAAA
jgi:glycosyltransferase involved in cell wall biosynthesis